MNCACADCFRAGINRPPRSTWSNMHTVERRTVLFGPKYTAKYYFGKTKKALV